MNRTILFLLSILIVSVNCSYQGHKGLIKGFLSDVKECNNFGAIRDKYQLITGDTLIQQRNEFLDIQLNSLQQYLKKVPLSDLVITRISDTSKYFYEDVKDGEIYTISQKDKTRIDFHILTEENKIISFTTMNKGGIRVFMSY
ncbi:hypothetical protein [Sphingobacterium tabacisoli]|uniref:Lipoprotein n=1 Tax=Sphingobacterium tabacisoli TaxID=2044855 RepID=A0ABW5L2W0_9SPHI|nr:hypothetical protein [Sphingobacterium tabacisoli]